MTLLREAVGGSVINKGVNGDTTAGILERFPRDVIDHRPDYALILSGTNDFIFLDLSPDEAMENFRKMAMLALENGIRPIFLTPCLTDPDAAAVAWVSETDYALVNQKLSELRLRMLETESTNPDIQVFDLQKHYQAGFVDGIHLTEAGHAWLASEIEVLLSGIKGNAPQVNPG